MSLHGFNKNERGSDNNMNNNNHFNQNVNNDFNANNNNNDGYKIDIEKIQRISLHFNF